MRPKSGGLQKRQGPGHALEGRQRDSLGRASTGASVGLEQQEMFGSTDEDTGQSPECSGAFRKTLCCQHFDLELWGNKLLLSTTPPWGLVSPKLLRVGSHAAGPLLATRQGQNPQGERSWVPGILLCQHW